MDRRFIGKYGEDLAVSYLEGKGYRILERNYRYKRGEIDVIALWQEELLVFCEVKKRKNSLFGEPEVFVSRNQQQLIRQTAVRYMEEREWLGDIRFDIIAISGEELVQLEDVFY